MTPSPAPWLPLPDAPEFPATGYAVLADQLAALLGTRDDVLLIQGEAMVALEATATSLGRPGLLRAQHRHLDVWPLVRWMAAQERGGGP